MTERPTEPFDPNEPPADTSETVLPSTGPSAEGSSPEAPIPVGPARIATTGPIAEPPGWTVPAPAEPGQAAAFSPEPDRIDRDRVAWQSPVQATPESWFEPTAPTPVPVGVPDRSRSRGFIAPVMIAALISATLASGGTYLALRASGALDRVGSTTTVPAGQTASVPQTVRIDEQSAIIDVAAKVSPAVVRIISSQASANDPNATTGIGSGIIYDKNGWILTNHHVVAGSDKLQVELKDGRSFGGTIYGIDTLTDLAIVKIEATDLPTATIGDSSTLKVGETTIAIGSPLGTYTSTVTSGILSATGRSIDVDSGRISNLLQTDTAINPGNSGGPLLDAGGNVIGVNTAIAANANGIGFAIPINIARPIMEQAVAGQKLARPYIGIRYEMLTLPRSTQLKLTVREGAYIDSGTDTTGQASPAVVPGGPADQAGVKAGDIIVTIEGQTLDTEHPLDSVLTQFAPGRTVTLGILRGSQKVEVQITLGTRPADL